MERTILTISFLGFHHRENHAYHTVSRVHDRENHAYYIPFGENHAYQYPILSRVSPQKEPCLPYPFWGFTIENKNTCLPSHFKGFHHRENHAYHILSPCTPELLASLARTAVNGKKRRCPPLGELPLCRKGGRGHQQPLSHNTGCGLLHLSANTAWTSSQRTQQVPKQKQKLVTLGQCPGCTQNFNSKHGRDVSFEPWRQWVILRMVVNNQSSTDLCP